MHLFHRIDDAEAVVRIKGGVFRQTEVFRRADKVYVKHGSGFVRLCGFRMGEVWGTSSPNVNVVDISRDVPGLDVGVESRTEPRWTGPQS